MKKFLAILLAIVMICSLSISAFADDEPTNPGSITVTGATKDKTYDLYKIFDLTYTGSAATNDLKVSYTIDTDWVDFFIGENAPGAAYLVTEQPTGTTLNPLTYNGDTYYINITEDNVADFAAAALAWCAGKNADATKTAGANGNIVFDNLELGYYLVYPQGADDIKDGYASLCSLDSTLPDAEVVVKATYPEITKTVDDPDVEVGQTVTFTITGKVPDTTGYLTYTYKFTDTMSKGLTFNDAVDNLVVKFGDTTITVPDGDKATYTIADNGFVLNFDMVQYQAYAGKTITVTYNAVVNDDAVVKLTENEVTLTYSNNPQGGETNTPPIDVPVYSSKIEIFKYDGATDADATNVKKLAGAEFVLIKLVEDPEDSSKTVEKYYKYTAATETALAKVEWVDSINDATKITTDTNGAATFGGLESGTYYLRETNPPTGYNQLTEDVEVTITAPTEETTGEEIGIAMTAKVANNSGAELPSTGGIGTTIFYVLGGVLLVGAAVLLITKKRMSVKG